MKLALQLYNITTLLMSVHWYLMIAFINPMLSDDHNKDIAVLQSWALAVFSVRKVVFNTKVPSSENSLLLGKD